MRAREMFDVGRLMLGIQSQTEEVQEMLQQGRTGGFEGQNEWRQMYVG